MRGFGNSYKKKESREEKMSRNNGGKGLKLDLKLNLSPPRESQYHCHQGLGGGLQQQSSSLVSTTTRNSPQYLSTSMSTTTTSSSMTSPRCSSCMTSEMEGGGGLRYSSSPEATSMVLVGCPRCLMYVMLSEDDPKCPRCKSTVLLDFLKDPNNINKNNKRSRKR